LFFTVRGDAVVGEYSDHFRFYFLGVRSCATRLPEAVGANAGAKKGKKAGVVGGNSQLFTVASTSVEAHSVCERPRQPPAASKIRGLPRVRKAHRATRSRRLHQPGYQLSTGKTNSTRVPATLPSPSKTSSTVIRPFIVFRRAWVTSRATDLWLVDRLAFRAAAAFRPIPLSETVHCILRPRMIKLTSMCPAWPVREDKPWSTAFSRKGWSNMEGMFTSSGSTFSGGEMVYVKSNGWQKRSISR